MENPTDYALTSDTDVATMLETARRSLLVLGVSEMEFSIRYLRNIAEGVLNATGNDCVFGEDPGDAPFIEEAMNARDRGMTYILRACGNLTNDDPLGGAIVKSLIDFIPMTPSGAGWSDLEGSEIRRAAKRVASGELSSHVHSLYELTAPGVSTEYALEVLRAA